MVEGTGRRIHILVAEDNEDEIVLLESAFEESGIPPGSYNFVRDGEEAMAYLRGQAPFERCPRPDLLLLDINMPRKNGFEVLQEVKEDPELRHIPVVMLTSSDREADVLRCYSTGASSYITKPVRYRDFRELAVQFAHYWTTVSRLPPPLHRAPRTGTAAPVASPVGGTGAAEGRFSRPRHGR
jgi:CheY-like chemotaxis protein